MNKQELIEEWSSKTRTPEPILIRESFNYADPVLGIYEQGFLDARTEILRDLEQLDEPQKPVVPKCIDEYIKLNPEACPAELFSYGWLYDNPSNLEDEVAKWLFDNDSKKNGFRHLIAVQAFVTRDYKVEKELLYIMPVPHISFSVHYCVEDDYVSFRQGDAQKFTQAELDRYFPDIKQFAVSVEEVVEG